MPIYGTPGYSPSGEFSFPRSYILQVTFGWGANTGVTQDGGNFLFTDLVFPQNNVVCNFKPQCWEWNSNGYSLDFLIEDWWLYVLPSTAPLPLNFRVDFQRDPVTHAPEWFIWAAGWTTRYTFSLPPAPSDYWLPMPNY